jgi:hypothetical protein
MNINEMTIGEVKEVIALIGAGAYGKRPENSFQPYVLGKDYLIRTVTHILIGTVIDVGDKEIVTRNTSWIADTGRYATALAKGDLKEVEPYPDDTCVIIGRGSVVDAARWEHPLPRRQI